jgi:hypothetical protein
MILRDVNTEVVSALHTPRERGFAPALHTPRERGFAPALHTPRERARTIECTLMIDNKPEFTATIDRCAGLLTHDDC